MQRLIFDYSPVYFVLSIALGIGYAFLLYSVKYNWSKSINRLLFVLRAILVSALMILLLSPVIRQTSNIFEKPTLVFLVDNSRSVKSTADTLQLLDGLKKTASNLASNSRSVEWRNLSEFTDSIQFTNGSSDLSIALRQTVTHFEGKNLAGIVLVSDGIYNNGLSPLYLPLRIPVYTVGVGDTTERSDLVLKNVAYNRVVYQGNKFPLRAEVGVTGLPNEEVKVTVQQQGKVLQQLTKNSATKSMLEFDFQLDGATQGIQRLEVRIERVAKESNLANNRASAFVEVVAGKKKILIVATAPHPDIKAFRSVLEKNPNYELRVHLVGVKELPASWMDPKDIDLLIAHQSPDLDGRTTALLTNFLKARIPTLIVIGQKTQLRMLPTSGVSITFDPSGQRDEVQPVLNSDFRDLGFSGDLNSRITRYPPVTVPFGKFTFPINSKIILWQRIGSLVTERPLLYVTDEGGQKTGVLMGEGIWKWRLSEFQETEKTAGFDELMAKLLQYLSTRDDRRRFRSFPLQHEFTSDNPVVIESQVYNDLFEPVYGNTIDIELRNDLGKVTTYRYTTGPGNNNRYRIGDLDEGIYRYVSTTEVKGKKESVKGEFLVLEQNQEARDLTADFGLLRNLATNTGGKFYPVSELPRLGQDLLTVDDKATIHSEESFHPLINLKFVFFLLLLLISLEWFLRKYMGAY